MWSCAVVQATKRAAYAARYAQVHAAKAAKPPFIRHAKAMLYEYAMDYTFGTI